MTESVSTSERLRQEYAKQLKEHNDFARAASSQSSSSGFRRILKNAKDVVKSHRNTSPAGFHTQPDPPSTILSSRNMRLNYTTEPILIEDAVQI